LQLHDAFFYQRLRVFDIPVQGLQLGLLVTAGFAAGFVDAIAGGGGLLTVPSLLAVGLPPHLALGTNKGQSVFGSFAALARFSRSGLVDVRQARATFPAGLVGAFGGAALLTRLDPAFLRPVVIVLLVVAGVVVATQRPPREVGQARTVSGSSRLWIASAAALAIGVYDGFFGPGTGTFLILAFVHLLKTPLNRATADAKVVNFASNLASVALFASKGLVVWSIALPMAAAQFAGGVLGAHLAIRRGDKVIKATLLLVVLGLTLKLARDFWVS
jgi:uncharacterized membrane protein YfcA